MFVTTASIQSNQKRYELKYVKQIKLYCSEHHPFPPLAARKVGDE